ncbi:MAG: RagB/SusD family nutrient uptake outer membrane protein, partial [Sphingobacteriales bacterium]
MKKQLMNSKYVMICLLAAVTLFQSCRKDLLKQTPTVDLAADAFWKTEADAQFALNGLYAAVRPCFDRDYYMDGHGEYTRARGGSMLDGNFRNGDAYFSANFNPTGYAGNWDRMYRYLYGAVNRANYVVANVNKMKADGIGNPATLDIILGEALMLRGLSYFKLISMWGDVPYFTFVVAANSEVSGLARTPITQVKDSILADLSFAVDKLPAKPAQNDRPGKPAALGLRGKVNLYWGSWKKNGWPELEGFTPSASEATTAFTAAAADFRSVINDFGLT